VVLDRRRATAAVAHGSQVTVVEVGRAAGRGDRRSVGAQTARYAAAGWTCGSPPAVEAVLPGGLAPGKGEQIAADEIVTAVVRPAVRWLEVPASAGTAWP
jgi:hypothetical protein